jgi:hypothetical protein
MCNSLKQYDIDFFTNIYASNESDKEQLSYEYALVAGFRRSSMGRDPIISIIVAMAWQTCSRTIQRPEKGWGSGAVRQQETTPVQAGQ